MSRLGEGWWPIGLSLGCGCWDGAEVAEWTMGGGEGMGTRGSLDFI